MGRLAVPLEELSAGGLLGEGRCQVWWHDVRVAPEEVNVMRYNYVSRYMSRAMYVHGKAPTDR